MKIYSLYDKKAMVYSPVMTFANDVFAIRAIESEMSNPKSSVATYPFDFCLMEIGTFDDSTGKISPREIPTNVYECNSYFSKMEEK